RSTRPATWPSSITPGTASSTTRRPTSPPGWRRTSPRLVPRGSGVGAYSALTPDFFDPSRESDRLQVGNEVRLVPGGHAQAQHVVVVIDDRRQRRGAPVVEIRRVLREPTQRRRPVHLAGAAVRVARVHAGLRGRVQLVLGASVSLVTAGAALIEDGAAVVRVAGDLGVLDHRDVSGNTQAELIGAQGVQLRFH